MTPNTIIILNSANQSQKGKNSLHDDESPENFSTTPLVAKETTKVCPVTAKNVKNARYMCVDLSFWAIPARQRRVRRKFDKLCHGRRHRHLHCHPVK